MAFDPTRLWPTTTDDWFFLVLLGAAVFAVRLGYARPAALSLALDVMFPICSAQPKGFDVARCSATGD